MAGLWQRNKKNNKSKASSALDRAENPTQTLDYSYEQMLTQLQNVKRGVADVVTAKKRLELQAQQDQLVSAQQSLESRIEAFRSEKEVIKAQYSAAQAQVKIGEAATGIGKGMQDTGMAIQRARDKTQELQARAGAIEE